jgi:hypothetical protein
MGGRERRLEGKEKGKEGRMGGKEGSGFDLLT